MTKGLMAKRVLDRGHKVRYPATDDEPFVCLGGKATLNTRKNMTKHMYYFYCHIYDYEYDYYDSQWGKTRCYTGPVGFHSATSDATAL